MKKLAVDLKLHPSPFNACLDGAQTKAVVDADLAEGRQLNVGGTPAFFVNGQLFFPRSLDVAEFARILNAGR